MPRRISLSISILLALAGIGAAGSGCRTRARHDDQRPAGVGFELPAGGPIARGALLTQPPGREEAFVDYVASNAALWVAACNHEAGDAPPLFSFDTDARGALRPAPIDPAATVRDRCLAGRAAEGAPSGLPADTHVKVQLVLRDQ